MPYREPPPLDDRIPEFVYPIAVEPDPFPPLVWNAEHRTWQWNLRRTDRRMSHWSPAYERLSGIEPDWYPPPPAPSGVRGAAIAVHAKLEAAWDLLATVLSEP
jgi:hypothetical protein